MIGKRFGRWKVEALSHNRSSSGGLIFLCCCECGRVREIAAESLRHGRSRSCGCFRTDTVSSYARKHGIWTFDRKLYHVWWQMIARCENPNHQVYRYYGARGIKVCRRWRKSVAAFVADMGPRPSGLTLERENNDGNYEPSNCRWATRAEQVHNRRCSISKIVVQGRSRARKRSADDPQRLSKVA